MVAILNDPGLVCFSAAVPGPFLDLAMEAQVAGSISYSVLYYYGGAADFFIRPQGRS